MTKLKCRSRNSIAFYVLPLIPTSAERQSALGKSTLPLLGDLFCLAPSFLATCSQVWCSLQRLLQTQGACLTNRQHASSMVSQSAQQSGQLQTHLTLSALTVKSAKPAMLLSSLCSPHDQTGSNTRFLLLPTVGNVRCAGHIKELKTW